jgi:hypothetical protein
MQLRVSFRIAGQAGSGPSAKTLGVMQLEPKTLGIPMHPRQWFWLCLLAAVFVFGAALLVFEPNFGIAFLAVSVVALPVLLPYILSTKLHQTASQGGLVAKILTLLAVLLYLRLAKSVLVPILMQWLTHIRS